MCPTLLEGPKRWMGLTVVGEGGSGLEGLRGIQGFITHCVARHRNEGAPHGRGDSDHVVDDAFILGVGDICDVKDLTHGVRQALQTAAGLLGFGN